MAVQLHGAQIETTHSLAERFERKHYLTPRDVGSAYGHLRHLCRKASDYPAEQINSLYFDTVDLDQHGRSEDGDYCKDKVRIRWYGEDDGANRARDIFIELKSKRGFANTKQRVRLRIPPNGLALDSLGNGIIPRTRLMEILAGFGHFPNRMLVPVIQISYFRHRFCEVMTGQRVSLDCRIRSSMVIPGFGNGEGALELPGAVVEIKGRSMELPEALRRIRCLDSDWTRFSKYSACLDSHSEGLGIIGRLSPSGRIVRMSYNYRRTNE